MDILAHEKHLNIQIYKYKCLTCWTVWFCKNRKLSIDGKYLSFCIPIRHWAWFFCIEIIGKLILRGSNLHLESNWLPIKMIFVSIIDSLLWSAVSAHSNRETGLEQYTTLGGASPPLRSSLNRSRKIFTFPLLFLLVHIGGRPQRVSWRGGGCAVVGSWVKKFNRKANLLKDHLSLLEIEVMSRTSLTLGVFWSTSNITFCDIFFFISKRKYGEGSCDALGVLSIALSKHLQ